MSLTRTPARRWSSWAVRRDRGRYPSRSARTGGGGRGRCPGPGGRPGAGPVVRAGTRRRPARSVPGPGPAVRATDRRAAGRHAAARARGGCGVPCSRRDERQGKGVLCPVSISEVACTDVRTRVHAREPTRDPKVVTAWPPPVVVSADASSPVAVLTGRSAAATAASGADTSCAGRAVSSWREPVSWHATDPPPRVSLNVPVSGHHRLLLVRADLERARAAAHACGGTINDLVLAAVAGGARRVLASSGELSPGWSSGPRSPPRCGLPRTSRRQGIRSGS